MEVKQMELNELLKSMNDLLQQGLKVSEAEKQLGFSDGKARKQLRDAGYKHNGKLKSYILENDKVTCSDGVTTQQDYKVEYKPIVTRSNGVLQQTEKKQELEPQPQQKPLFTVEQVDILQQIIKEYQTRQQIQSVADQNKGKTINRNVRVYEKQFEAFANWCKVNNVTQADALYKAIDLIMNGKD